MVTMAWTDCVEQDPGPERFSRPETTNRAIGAVLRRWRCTVGATQKDVADGMGISFQQLQKYESGMNRISLLRLMEYCAALGVSPHAVLAEILDACDLQGPPMTGPKQRAAAARR